MIRKEQLYEQILEQIDLTKETDDEELQELIRTVLDEAADEEYIPLSDKIRIGRELFNSFRKLDVLQELLEDDSITEITISFMRKKEEFSGLRSVFCLRRDYWM
jgi:pilus assembly protein CpaF